jgi:hypothetical protein
MLQTACLADATERSNRNRRAVLASDDDSLGPLGMRPHLVQATLAHDLPACVEPSDTNLAVYLRHRSTVGSAPGHNVATADIGQSPDALAALATVEAVQLSV